VHAHGETFGGSTTRSSRWPNAIRETFEQEARGMIQASVARNGALTRQTVTPDDTTTLAEAIWIDLVAPTEEEGRAVEQLLGIDAPTREEQAEIEVSSRLYEENGALFVTVTLLANAEQSPHNAPVTFILLPDRLVTVRYDELRPFTAFCAQLDRQPSHEYTATGILAGLFEAIVERIADLLEQIGMTIETLQRDIFHQPKKNPERQSSDLQQILRRIGLAGNLAAQVRESLVTVGRAVSFLGFSLKSRNDPVVRGRIRSLAQDVRALSDHDSFLNDNLSFLLDATLGLINIQQNTIIKIFSIAAVIFLPPTLIGTVYGMNFQYMPELAEPWGYPAALVAMALSAVLPFALFKRQGWL
ncbi:MAG: magnesium transporter CorA family protein, partial [Dehalococcoidia bacterium]|nr:magnesium transporter CorA family protein [Dehalococcoidia bacterium]